MFYRFRYVTTDLILEETSEGSEHSPVKARIGTPGRAAALQSPWFDSANHATCGALALEILARSLECGGKPCATHQNALAAGGAATVAQAAHWLGRRGPVEFITPSLRLLRALVAGGNEHVAAILSSYTLNVPHGARGRSLPHSRAISDAKLQFGADVPPADDFEGSTVGGTLPGMVHIPLVSLLAELFIVDRRPATGVGSSGLSSFFWCIADPRVASGTGCPVPPAKEVIRTIRTRAWAFRPPH